MSQAADLLEGVFRQEYGRVLATLIRHLGDIELAEDALQEAMMSALKVWDEKPPANPGAWLTTTARRKAIDVLRRSAVYAKKQQELTYLTGLEQNAYVPEEESTMLVDDQLRLMFTCCHPSLGNDAQVALTLKTLGGLTTKEISRAFMIPESTMAQRLVRAKKKINTANIPYRVPTAAELPSRLAPVLQVIYLVFNEGYLAADGDQLVRRELATEALRLGHLLNSQMPAETEIAGLVSLMSFHLARFGTRTNAEGGSILLEDQDRNCWDRTAIHRADALLTQTLAAGGNGPYVLQAAIAGLHATAPSFAETRWDEIVFLYEQLHRIMPNPVVALNRTVAVAMASGPAAALRDLANLEVPLASYPHFHSAKARLLAELGSNQAALASYMDALQLTSNAADRAFLEAKISTLR